MAYFLFQNESLMMITFYLYLLVYTPSINNENDVSCLSQQEAFLSFSFSSLLIGSAHPSLSLLYSLITKDRRHEIKCECNVAKCSKSEKKMNYIFRWQIA